MSLSKIAQRRWNGVGAPTGDRSRTATVACPREPPAAARLIGAVSPIAHQRGCPLAPRAGRTGTERDPSIAGPLLSAPRAPVASKTPPAARTRGQTLPQRGAGGRRRAWRRGNGREAVGNSTRNRRGISLRVRFPGGRSAGKSAYQGSWESKSGRSESLEGCGALRRCDGGDGRCPLDTVGVWRAIEGCARPNGSIAAFLIALFAPDCAGERRGPGGAGRPSLASQPLSRSCSGAGRIR